MQVVKKSEEPRPITYRDIVKQDPHPYTEFFNPDILHRAQVIETQRQLAETFQQISLEMRAAEEAAKDPRAAKIRERLQKKLAAKKKAKESIQ